MADRDIPDADVTGERATVDVVADEFADRLRHGELPSVTEYVRRYPEHADELRDLLPAVVMMEQLKRKDDSQLAVLERQTAAAHVTQLGDFRIVREIGKGGMGVVYEAEQESLGRHVALKVLSPAALGSETAIARFHREAETVAQLHHTNIVPVFGVGEEDGLHYYVMQLISGQPLSDVIRELSQRQELPESPPAPPPQPPHQSRSPVGSCPLQTGDSQAQAEACSNTWHHDTQNRDSAQSDSARFDGTRPGSAVRTDSSSQPGSVPENTGTEQSQAAALDETHIRSTRSSEKVQTAAASSTSPLAAAATDRVTADSSVPAALAHALRTGHYWRSVAQIGVQVARALDYAHRHGVWHRDIKPSNLLIDDDGIVWVVDFGLARLAEDSELTQTGDLLGTLRYMAPEQLSGQFDSRSDLYSLGLTLFELLAFQPAHQATLRTQLLQQVTDARPRSPRAIHADVPRDLDTIVLKTTSHDPEHRYQTAGELADDLQRYLDGFPIRARRTGPVEQLVRWRKRNPALAATSLAAMVLLFAVAVISTWGFVATREAYRQLETEQQNVIDERDKVQQERQKAIAEGQRAEENLEFALGAFEELLSELSARSSAVSVDFDLEDEDLSAVTLTTIPQEDAELLLRLLDFYRGFAENNTGSPKAATYAAKAQHAIGDIRQRLGQFDQAVDAYNEAIRQYEQAWALVTDPVEFATTLARLLNSLGIAESRRGNFHGAWLAHADARDVLLELPDTIRLSRENRFLLAQTLNLQASIHLRSGLAEIARPGLDGSGFGRGISGRGRGIAILARGIPRTGERGRRRSDRPSDSRTGPPEDRNGRTRGMRRPGGSGPGHHPGGGPFSWLFSSRRDAVVRASSRTDRHPDAPENPGRSDPAGRSDRLSHSDHREPPQRMRDVSRPVDQSRPLRPAGQTPPHTSRQPEDTPQSMQRHRGGPPPQILAEVRQAQQEARTLLTQLVAEEPDNPRYRLELSRAWLNSLRAARPDAFTGDHGSSQSLTDLHTAIRILDDLAADYPDEDVYRIELADALALSTPQLEHSEPPEERLRRLERSVEIARDLSARSPDVSRYGDRLGRSLRALAAEQSRAGNDAAALRTLLESVAVLQRTVDERPHQFAYRFSLARSLEDASRLQYRSRQRDQAAESLERAVTVIRSALPELDEQTHAAPAVRGMYGLLMTLLKSAGRDDEAREIRHRLERFRPGGPPHSNGDGYHPGRPDGPPWLRNRDRTRPGPPGSGPHRPGFRPERLAPPADPRPAVPDNRPDDRDRPESPATE